MYNSSLKGKNVPMTGVPYVEIPEKVFEHDMTIRETPDCFKTCDCVYSEPAWQYGYPIFNERAGFVASDGWSAYSKSIDRTVMEIGKPAFIIGGKIHARHFADADDRREIEIMHDGTSLGGAFVYLFNGADYDDSVVRTTDGLTDYLCKEYEKALDFSCGYGEHLLKFRDFIGTDIDRNCLAYLSGKVRGAI